MAPQFTGQKSATYVAAPDVVETVNLAIALGRPLLAEGEPGCGKTRLAYAIAEELKLGDPIDITVKSTSKARDLLYRFDALRRLQDVQNPAQPERAQFVAPYIDLEPLGTAIHEGRRCVVLIDEIDKADLDFPNDLLEVLDTFRFTIDDVPVNEADRLLEVKGYPRTVEGPRSINSRPIVVITSNQEKRLPEPFLRRCLYLYLSFPKSKTLLASIVQKNLKTTLDGLSDKLIEQAVTQFVEIREMSIKRGPQKAPATSELIDWVHALHWANKTPEEVEQGGSRPPFWPMLFKTLQDLKTHKVHSSEEDKAQVE